MPKKTTKVVAKKPAPAKAEKPAKRAAVAEKPAAQASAPKPKAPAAAAKPVPPHQQFLAKGVKPQAMMKARIIRHQGR